MKGKTILLFLVFGFVASTALAQKPVKSEYAFAWPPNVIEAGSICSFAVNMESTAKITELDFYDQGGSLIRMDFHLVEQDTFSANGKSLTGVPFPFNARFLFDSEGNLMHQYVDGIVEKVFLPDGSLFISAGRFDFAAHGFPEFVLVPDHGTAGNIRGFCEALAP